MSAPGAAAPPHGAARLRTVFCTRPGLYGACVLARLRGCAALELCGIVHSTRILDPRFGWWRGAQALLGRCGSAYALYLWCATTLAERLGGAASVGGIRGVAVHATRDLNTPAGLKFLARCAPDLLVSAFFDQRLGAAALAVPTRGCVNIHPSLLPDFRGVDPVLQARLARAGSLGVTLHWMTPRLDEGAILAQRAVALAAGTSLLGTTAALFAAGAELLAANVGRIAGRDLGIPQSSPGSYQSWPTRSEVRALRGLGVPLLRISDLASLASGGRARGS